MNSIETQDAADTEQPRIASNLIGFSGIAIGFCPMCEENARDVDTASFGTFECPECGFYWFDSRSTGSRRTVVSTNVTGE